MNFSDSSEDNLSEKRIEITSRFFQTFKKGENEEKATEITNVVRDEEIVNDSITDLFSSVYKKLFNDDITHITSEYKKSADENNDEIEMSNMLYDIAKYHFGKIIEAEKAERDVIKFP